MSSRFLRPLISKIEIERKFLPTRPLLHALTLTSTTVPTLPPSIARAHPALVHFIRDIYYDRHDERLAAEGLWVRRRSVVGGSSTSSLASSWEAKVRVGGDFAASQFVEVEGAEAVEREVRRVLGDCVALDKIGEQLVVMSDLTTRRLSGRLELHYEDGNDVADELQLQNLTVAIDQVVETTAGDFAASRAVLEQMQAGRDGGGVHNSPDLFFHEIGELELMTEVRTEAAAIGNNQAEHHTREHETRRKAVAGARAAQLEAFMRAHPALFPMTPRPRGKLNAYFSWRKDRAAPR
ncbi:hypothetical protein C8F04DRAFT_741054 [Mycena alexandri]|uniref:CYTH domain-containing protein n=1 Tax=Mycena alexandri TaxID=1745969 RepID=A0AAD6SLC7_9AGAR|nr:hypothetical protein C8F04DRAFT_741054 [Mycena alexandri]